MRIALILTLLTLTGCSKTWSDKDIAFVSVSQAKALFAEEGGTWLKESKPNVWVDARNPSRYTIGHIPGAINIPLRSIDTQWGRVKSYGTVIVYGDTWNDPLADAESKVFLEKGVENVQTLHGGWQAWTEAGGASEPGADSKLVESETTRAQRTRRDTGKKHAR